MAKDLQNKTISILGCGWLGLALGKALVQAKANVQGSTTTPEKVEQIARAGIAPFLIDLNKETPISDRFTKVNCLVISLPPKASDGDYSSYFAQLNRLAEELEKSEPDRVIFLSSTGVYPDKGGDTREEMAAPHTARAEALLHAEAIMQSLKGNKTTVLRLGGLFGPARHPGRFLAGKTNVPNGAALLNFIHQADAVVLIRLLIENGITGQTFHACADEHPTREVFYTRAATLSGLPAPTFTPSETADFTWINSLKIKQALGYRFQFPDPLLALDALDLPLKSN